MKNRIATMTVFVNIFIPALVDGQDASKKLNDGDITKLLVGKWRMEDGVQSDVSFNGDTTFVMQEKVILPDETREMTSSGTWRVLNGAVEMNIKKTNVPGLKGVVNKHRVISIGDTTLEIEAEEPEKKLRSPPEIFTFKRMKR